MDGGCCRARIFAANAETKMCRGKGGKKGTTNYDYKEYRVQLHLITPIIIQFSRLLKLKYFNYW